MARAGDDTSAAQGGRAALVPVIGAIAGSLLVVLVHPVVGLPVAASAIGALWARGRGSVAIVSAVAGGAVATALSSVSAYILFVPLMGVPVTARVPYVHFAWVTVSLLVCGILTVGLLKRLGALSVVGIVTLVLSAVELIAVASLASGAGLSVTEYVTAATREMAALAGMADELVDAFVEGWPALLVTMSGATALFAVAAVAGSASRFDQRVRRFPALADLDLDPKTALLAIAAVGALAVGRFVAETAPVVEQAGMNLLVVARMVFLLQGVAVFAGLYRRAGVSRPFRFLGFAILGVTEMLFPAVSLTGLADIWLNLRRLPRDGATPGDRKDGPAGT
ncbi:MAG TPA: hypothetical protein DCP20_02740 [Coriobacteriia bacterium]|jgi:hypothetical protein|nr:MAG: Uncharacterized protein XD74_0943 [Actinobacteria bacterium 66_15]HAL29619.1 hypothetical protein [Coriobacteriia bacterium]